MLAHEARATQLPIIETRLAKDIKNYKQHLINRISIRAATGHLDLIIEAENFKKYNTGAWLRECGYTVTLLPGGSHDPDTFKIEW
jgi:hypothetical protein